MKGKGTQTTYWLLGEDISKLPHNLSSPSEASNVPPPPPAPGNPPTVGGHHNTTANDRHEQTVASVGGVLKSALRNTGLSGSQHLTPVARTQAAAVAAAANRRSSPNMIGGTMSSNAAAHEPATQSSISFADAPSVRYSSLASRNDPARQPLVWLWNRWMEKTVNYTQIKPVLFWIFKLSCDFFSNFCAILKHTINV